MYEGRIKYAQSFLARDENGVEVAIKANRFVKIVEGGGVVTCDGTETDRNGVGVSLQSYAPLAADAIFQTQPVGLTVATEGAALVEAAGPIKRGERVGITANGRVEADAAGLWRSDSPADLAGDLVLVVLNAD